MAARSVSPLVALLGRLLWMMFGPLLLLVLGFFIASQGGGWWTAMDIMFFLILGIMLLGRWLEFLGGNPQRATGEPASPDDLRRYWFIAAVAGIIVWLLANVLGNHLFPG